MISEIVRSVLRISVQLINLKLIGRELTISVFFNFLIDFNQ